MSHPDEMDWTGHACHLSDRDEMMYADDLVCLYCMRDENPLGPRCTHVKENPEAVAAAKALCNKCPLGPQGNGECLDLAIGTREVWGIWGGLTANERGAMIRSMRRRQETVPDYRIKAGA